MDEGRVVYVIHLDFTKAFDKVPPYKTVEKDGSERIWRKPIRWKDEGYKKERRNKMNG